MCLATLTNQGTIDWSIVGTRKVMRYGCVMPGHIGLRERSVGAWR